LVRHTNIDGQMPKKSAEPTPKDSIALARKTVAVAVAMGRAKCLGVIIHEEINKHRDSGLPELSDQDWREFEVNGATRLASLYVAYFAALDAVVDGWVRGGLSDSRVDPLLQSHHKQVLSGFRDAMLHPRSLVDDRLKRLHANRRELLPWADQLADTFEVAFKQWFAVLRSPGDTPPNAGGPELR
jgi:hypothetical protein